LIRCGAEPARPLDRLVRNRKRLGEVDRREHGEQASLQPEEVAKAEPAAALEHHRQRPPDARPDVLEVACVRLLAPRVPVQPLGLRGEQRPLDGRVDGGRDLGEGRLAQQAERPREHLPAAREQLHLRLTTAGRAEGARAPHQPGRRLKACAKQPLAAARGQAADLLEQLHLPRQQRRVRQLDQREAQPRHLGLQARLVQQRGDRAALLVGPEASEQRGLEHAALGGLRGAEEAQRLEPARADPLLLANLLGAPVEEVVLAQRVGGALSHLDAPHLAHGVRLDLDHHPRGDHGAEQEPLLPARAREEQPHKERD